MNWLRLLGCWLALCGWALPGAAQVPLVLGNGGSYALAPAVSYLRDPGGSLTLESAPGAGTTIVVEVASADPNPDR